MYINTYIHIHIYIYILYMYIYIYDAGSPLRSIPLATVETQAFQRACRRSSVTATMSGDMWSEVGCKGHNNT